MRLNQITLPSTDIARAILFYQGLGLLLIVHKNDDYARLMCPDGEGTLSLLRVSVPPSSPQTVVYFDCPDLDAWVEDLKGRGYQFTRDPITEPWLWREAHLLDPDGNPICLFSPGQNRLEPPWRLPASQRIAPFLGRWELDAAQSHYQHGPAPRRGTYIIRPLADGLSFSLMGETGDGEPIGALYRASVDPQAERVMKLVDDRTLDTTVYVAGKEVSHARHVLSKEGSPLAMPMTMTVTMTQAGITAAGQRFDNVSIYRKP